MKASVVPIAISFLDRLMFETSPSEAIATLSSVWQNRSEPHAPLWGLDSVEYRVQLCLIYTGEVGNGGHTQFFMNRGGQFVPDTCTALEAVGLPTLCAILERAVAEFPNGTVPPNVHDAESAIDGLSSKAERRLEELDRQAWGLLGLVDDALLVYLRTNRLHVLLPEAPLEKRSGRLR
jgi:hypothetical protein